MNPVAGKPSGRALNIDDQGEPLGQPTHDRASGRFPFVFLDEAHFYTSDEEILNLITRDYKRGEERAPEWRAVRPGVSALKR